MKLTKAKVDALIAGKFITPETGTLFKNSSLLQDAEADGENVERKLETLGREATKEAPKPAAQSADKSLLASPVDDKIKALQDQLPVGASLDQVVAGDKSIQDGPKDDSGKNGMMRGAAVAAAQAGLPTDKPESIFQGAPKKLETQEDYDKNMADSKAAQERLTAAKNSAPVHVSPFTGKEATGTNLGIADAIKGKGPEIPDGFELNANGLLVKKPIGPPSPTPDQLGGAIRNDTPPDPKADAAGFQAKMEEAQILAQQHASQAAQAAYASKMSQYKKDLSTNFTHNMIDPLRAGQDIAGREGELKSQQADEEYLQHVQTNAENKTRMEQDESERKRNQEIANKKLQQIDDINSKLSQEELDPSRYWHDKGTFEKVSLGLASIVAGAASRGAVSIIDDINQKDIAMQMESFKRRKEGNDAARTILGDYISVMRDDEAGRARYRIELLKQSQEELKRIAAKYGGPQAKLNAEKGINDIQQLIGQQNQKLWSAINPPPAVPATNGGVTDKEIAAKAFELLKDKDFQPPPGMSREQAAFQSAYSVLVRQGRGSPGATVADGKDNKEEKRIQTELDGTIATIQAAKRDVSAITKGTTIGSAFAKAPAWLGSEEARKDLSVRESYNNKARVAVGAAYKLGTDTPEPKRLELLQEYMKPYEIHADDNEKSALSKMDNLEDFIKSQGAAKGVVPVSISSTPDASGGIIKPGLPKSK